MTFCFYTMVPMNDFVRWPYQLSIKTTRVFGQIRQNAALADGKVCVVALLQVQ